MHDENALLTTILPLHPARWCPAVPSRAPSACSLLRVREYGVTLYRLGVPRRKRHPLAQTGRALILFMVAGIEPRRSAGTGKVRGRSSIRRADPGSSSASVMSISASNGGTAAPAPGGAGRTFLPLGPGPLEPTCTIICSRIWAVGFGKVLHRYFGALFPRNTANTDPKYCSN